MQKADREQPVGERRLWWISEYILELRTEQAVGCGGLALVMVLK